MTTWLSLRFVKCVSLFKMVQLYIHSMLLKITLLKYVEKNLFNGNFKTGKLPLNIKDGSLFLGLGVELLIKFVAMNMGYGYHGRHLEFGHSAYKIDQITRSAKNVITQYVNFYAVTTFYEKHFLMKIASNEHVRLWWIHHHSKIFMAEAF